MIIYHNPKCSKSREALSLLEKNNCKFEIINYLKQPPSVKELSDLLKKLKCNPKDIIRKKEALYLEKYKDKNLTNDKWLEILSKNPILIERPIVVNGNKAIIGRPPELIINLL